jgi:hypothetical protein
VVPENPLSGLLPGAVSAADFGDRVRRGKRYRSVGALGVVGSIALFVLAKLIAQTGGPLTATLLTLLFASVALIVWTRLWFRESKEPFQYTYSITDFARAPHPESEATPVGSSPIEWLALDLKEKLAERVPRLSLLEAKTVPDAEPDGVPGSHVHISGWHGMRGDADRGWELEVVAEVRLGGVGAPSKLARSVRLKLDDATCDAADEGPPRLNEDGYRMLFERVYWSVASQIYAQIQRGVEEKVKLLPRGSLRASAYVHEADDYATSNTLDAYAAAQDLYRKALEIYDIQYREAPATPWRQTAVRFLTWVNRRRCEFRHWRAGLWRRSGRREVMTARAELGLARMLVAEWHLGQLCGMFRKEIYEAPRFANAAISRLKDVPRDISEREETLFRAHVARATIRYFLRDLPGAREALSEAEEQLPATAWEDADFLFANGIVESNLLRSLRLLGQAVELSPTMERALFHRAEQYDDIWRRQSSFEIEVARLVDAEYRDVTALNPGNLSAWGRLGYLGWLLAEESSGEQSAAWQASALSALEAGRQYKEVRRDATVAELDWNLARLAAERGAFDVAYKHYIEAVSARLANPRIDFEEKFYRSPTKRLVTRFREYERRVKHHALAGTDVSTRLVKSVKAFVFNDCGLAYQAHYERSGSEKSLVAAEAAFQAAQRENQGFILPTHNLAKLHCQFAELPGRSPEEAQELLRIATELLADVLRREPEWAPAQLLMIATQTELAAGIEAELRADEEEAEAERSEGGEAAERPERGVSARIDQLVSLRATRQEAIVANLQNLLPQLRTEGGGHRVDLSGTQVAALLKDSAIHWTTDFNSIHVAALTQWCKAMARTAPAAACALCEKLRATFYDGERELLVAHWIAAQALAGDERATKTVEECEGRFREMVREALLMDPVHLSALEGTNWLPSVERQRALETALEAGPSATALIWIGAAQHEMDDFAGAIETYERARREAGKAMRPFAALSLAKLLEERGIRRADAIDAFRAATESSDAPVAAEGAAGAARLVAETENGQAALREYLRVASRPEVALYLGNALEAEARRNEALRVYRKGLGAEGDDESKAALRIQLALALSAERGKLTAAAERHLRQVVAEDLLPSRWEAALHLASGLRETKPTTAKRCYERVLEESDPTATSIAAWELGTMMEARGEGEQAHRLYLERARDDPAVATWLIERKEERGDEDVEAFREEINAATTPA